MVSWIGAARSAATSAPGFLVVVTSQLLLVFHASVLEPSFHLSFTQVQCVSEFNAFGSGQVALLFEAAFEAVQLLIRKDGAGLTSTSRLSPCVGRQQRP